MEVLIVILVILVVIAGALIVMYNNLVTLKNRVKNAWSQVDVQLQRRHDLIPNLVESVKGYASHESSALEAVIRARSAAVSASSGASDTASVAKAENMLTGALRQLFALSEAYPDLKANANFIDLQEKLNDTENKLSYARMSYNDCVMAYDNAREQFPSNIVANMFAANFPKAEPFDAPVESEAAPQVKF